MIFLRVIVSYIQGLSNGREHFLIPQLIRCPHDRRRNCYFRRFEQRAYRNVLNPAPFPIHHVMSCGRQLSTCVKFIKFWHDIRKR